MKINKYMFREYDIRGVYGKDINEEVSYLIGRAFGTKLKRLGKTTTLVGYDNRYSSPVIEENLVKGIIECGVDVVRLGLVTTPMYYYGWDLLDIHSGIMVTASHNPKDDNGFKFSYNGIHNAYGESSLELYQIILKEDFISNQEMGTIKNVDIKQDYINMITSNINLGNRKLKVIYDCGNGTTSIVADAIFNKFQDKLELVPLFNESDSNFPNHHPDPAVEENLSILKKYVKENHADIGIAFDGDGDRVGIIDEKGNFLDIDKYMILIWRDLVKRDVEKKTFYDVKCSLALKEELDKLGIKNEFYRTGNSYTKAKSAEGNYPFSGELSGHVFFRDKFNGYDDGIYAGLRLIEILSHQNKTISQLLEGISHYESTPEIKIQTNDDIKFHIIDQVKEYCQSKKYDILLVDGVKVFFPDGSALVRASNTGPNITTRFEAKTKARLMEIQNEFMNLIENLKVEKNRESMRTITDILDNQQTYECMGCETANHQLIPPGGIIYEDDFINIAADFEIPIPGFMILGINKHVRSINQMTKQERTKVMEVLNQTAEIVKKVCQVEEVTIIQEERAKHFHIWILPNYKWMDLYGKGCLGIKEKFEVAKQNNNSENIHDCLEKVEAIRNEFKEILKNYKSFYENKRNMGSLPNIMN